MRRNNNRRCGGFSLGVLRAILPRREFVRAAVESRCVRRRSCVLVPELVCWLMMYVALETTSMTQGLLRAWTMLTAGRLTRRPKVSEEAFCLAREALPLRFFKALLKRLDQRYQDRFDSANRWKGRFRVLAGDGTTITLLANAGLAAVLGTAANQSGKAKHPQARLTALCSVFTGFCVGFVLSPLRFSESVGMRHLVRHLRSNDLVLLDRLFFSYAIIRTVLDRRAHAVIRIQARYAAALKRLRRLARDHWLVEPRPNLRMGLVRYQRKGFRVSWLVTTLTDPGDATAAELVNLYHRRWSIETIYREWKHTLDVQNIRSVTAIGVHKEVAAQVLLHNLVRWAMTEAAQTVNTTPVRLSFTTSLTLVRAFASATLGLPTAVIRRRYAALLRQIAAATVLQRPGRSYPRPFDHIARNKGNGHSAHPARLAKVA